MRKLLQWSAPVIVGHFFVVLWHLWLLVRVQASTPRFLPPLLISINLIPLLGLLLLYKGFPRIAGILVALPLGTAFVAGVSAHFINRGSDNVLHMPPTPHRLPYAISAVLLVVLEALGCWAGLRMLFTRERFARPNALNAG
jgi:hypothetical protein